MNTKAFDFCCNGAREDGLENPRHLDYRPVSATRNVRIGLSSFVRDVYHIPKRTLDLLELAAYVFAADRMATRGKADALEFHSWSRRFHIRTKVRDLDFWTNADVEAALSRCLTFMTGDAEFSFSFEGGHSTEPTSLFDREDFERPSATVDPQVTLFSGGLDSLCGVMRSLVSTDSSLILVSHQAQPVVKKVQAALVKALRERFPGRLHHYAFGCSLSGVRATEETQRSRTFLYAAIGFAICQAFGSRVLTVYENGVTSLNLRRREDLANARASRTTHPRSLTEMKRFLGLVADESVEIATPFLWKTKRDIVEMLVTAGGGELIASSVSCTRTFRRLPNGTHCGQCFQCIDRRMAMFAAGENDFDDAGLYSCDIIREQIRERGAKTAVVDYVRQAAAFAGSTVDGFGREYLRELADLDADLLGASTDLDAVERVWGLVNSHGVNVREGIRRMRELYDDPLEDIERSSLLGLVASRAHRDPPVIRLAERIGQIVEDAIGILFSVERPTNEPDFNSKIAALVGSHTELASEHPTMSFACARVVPDHTLRNHDLLIEAKYIRGHTPPSKATEGIAADLTKYPERCHILFLVYDPDRRISNDRMFARDFERKGRCSVRILR